MKIRNNGFFVIVCCMFAFAGVIMAQGVNIAPLGEATQSTVGWSGVATRAIDGNTNGNYSGGNSVTHTAQGDPTPWWQVDLGEMYPLESIMLWNRTDACCPNRLSNFQVLVLDDGGLEVWSEAYFEEGLSYVDPLEGLEILLPDNTEGQVVRIEILGPSTPNTAGATEMFLSLAEVQVFRSAEGLPPEILVGPAGGVASVGDTFSFSVEAIGEAPLSYQWKKDDVDIAGATESVLVLDVLQKSDAGSYTVVVTNDIDSVTSEPVTLEVPGFNLARIGQASQSTTGHGGVPERAIDGIIDGVYNNNSITHTVLGDLEPWWEVDLGDIFPMSIIVLWNRVDCCSNRLSNFRVSVLDDGRDVLWSAVYFEEGLEYVDPIEGLTIPLPEDTEGQFVRIEIMGESTPNNVGVTEMYLSLVEVQIFGDADNLAPIIIAQPQGARITAGEPFQFSVNALASPPVQYQWQRDGDDIAGATEPTLIMESVTMDDNGEYTVVVTNDAGSVTSEPAMLFVPGTNLAVRGQASQSSIGFTGDPKRAIDGNTNGVYTNNSVTHTRSVPMDPEPWWEVALAGTSTVELISLWNRTDCCHERLSNFQVSVMDEDRDVVFSDDFFTDGLGFPDPGFPFDIEVPGVEGKYVRVEILDENFNGESILSLAEVEVFGVGPEAPPDPNLARRPEAVASQSSQSGGFGPQLALDGNMGNFTHTQSGANLPATWQVDLGAMHDIATIVLHNRTSCCGSRLRDITVFVLDAADGDVLFESDLLNPENELGAFPLGPDRLTVDLVALTGDVVNGRVVRVVRTPDPDLSGGGDGANPDEADVLSLGEVEIFGPFDCPAEGDTHCLGLVLEGPDDDGPGMYILRASASDDSGDVPMCTFTVDNGEDPPRVFGPQRVYSTEFLLPPGEWTVSLEVDDSSFCEDAADDAVCSVQLALSGDPNNVALSGIATQSTTAGGGAASRAIDGITEGIYNYGSVTQTAGTDLQPWWEVDLGRQHALSTIVLWNRTDPCVNCQERLSNFAVVVEDEGGNPTYSESFFTDGFDFVVTLDEGFEIELPEGTEGRFVRVEILGPGVSGETLLTLAEVQVFSDGIGPTGISVNTGDVNGDGNINLADAISLLTYLFVDKSGVGCLKAADANDDAKLDLADAITILTYQFTSGTLQAPDGTLLGSAAAGGDRPAGCYEYPEGEVSDLGCVTPCAK